VTSTKLLKMAEKLIVDNAPTILTGIGVVGTATTAYLTGKATFKAAKLIEKESFKTKIQTPAVPGRLPDEDPLSNVEKVKIVWKVYVLPAAVGVGTIAAIFYANRINTKRAAALAAAYAISQDKFSDYKDKVADKLGVKKEQAIKDELAQDQVNKNPPSGDLVIVGNGTVLCRDEFTGRYFRSSVEAIKRAENEINFEIINSGYATVSDFYERIGLKPTSVSEQFGWNVPTRKLELAWTAIITPDDEPCMAFDFNAYPLNPYGICAAE